MFQVQCIHPLRLARTPEQGRTRGRQTSSARKSGGLDPTRHGINQVITRDSSKDCRMNGLDDLADAATAILQEAAQGKMPTRRVKLLAQRWLRETSATLALHILLDAPTSMDIVDFCRRILDLQRACSPGPVASD